MKYKITLLLACLALAFVLPCGAATLDDCFRAALKQSESLAGQQELVKQASEHYRQALAAMLPSLNANFISYNYDTTQVGTSSGFVSNPSSARLTLSLPLFRGFRDFAALGQTQNLTAAQRQAYSAAALQLYGDVAQAFYLVRSLEDDLAIRQNEIGLYDQRIADLERRVAIGRSRQTEVLTVQVALATLVAEINQDRAALAAARELLAFLTGLPVDGRLQDDIGLPDRLDPPDIYLNRLDERPDVKAASLETAAAQNDLDIARRAYLPSADLSGNYYFSRSQSSLMNSKWDLTATLSQPLFQGGYLVSKQAEAESLLRQSRLDFQRVRRLAEQSLRTLYQQVACELAQTRDFKVAAQLAEENYKAESADYLNGLVTNLDVLAALTAYHDTARAYTAALFAAKSDLGRLRAAAVLVELPEPKQ